MKQTNNSNKEECKKMVVFVTSFASEMGAIKDLLVLLRKKKEAIEIDREYQIRKFFGPWGLKELTELYRENSINKLNDATLYYCKRNLLKGMRRFSYELKEKGFLVGALSSDPQFMMDILKEIAGLDFAHGMELEFERGIATGNITKEFNRYHKAKFLREKREKLNIPKENIIVIGRASVIHLPIIKESNTFIGFDPRENTDISEMIVANRNLKKIFSGRS